MRKLLVSLALAAGLAGAAFAGNPESDVEWTQAKAEENAQAWMGEWNGSGSYWDRETESMQPFTDTVTVTELDDGLAKVTVVMDDKTEVYDIYYHEDGFRSLGPDGEMIDRVVLFEENGGDWKMVTKGEMTGEDGTLYKTRVTEEMTGGVMKRKMEMRAAGGEAPEWMTAYEGTYTRAVTN